jgi:hypothetical protein
VHHNPETQQSLFCRKRASKRQIGAKRDTCKGATHFFQLANYFERALFTTFANLPAAGSRAQCPVHPKCLVGAGLERHHELQHFITHLQSDVLSREEA